MAKESQYKYGDRIVIGGKDMGEARFNEYTGKPLKPPKTPKAGGTPTPPPVPNSTGDAFLSAIQNKLLEQTGVISSTNSNLENRISSAIAGIRESTEASNAAIESRYDREIDFEMGQAELGIQTHLENRVGYGTQMVALRNLVETTDKSIKDMEMRKNELILQNNAEAASKISDMQMKALEFRQQAEQQVFSNLLGIANFGVTSAQEARLAKQQTFQEKAAMSEIALQYGISISPNDTLDTITSKAMVFASEEQKARLAKLQAETRKLNAEAAKVISGNGKNVPIGDDMINRLAHTYNEIKGKKDKSQQDIDEMNNILGAFSDNKANLGKFYKAVADDASAAAKEDMVTLEASRAAAANQPPQRGIFSRFSDFITGKDLIDRQTKGFHLDPKTGRVVPN